MTRAPSASAIRQVASVEPESTTRISSAKLTLSRAPASWRSSSRVMITAESNVTQAEYKPEPPPPSARAVLRLAGVAHYRLTLAYDGTEFAGWQRQAAQRTVQGELEQALSRLSGGAAVTVAGAGRTDAGVHALGQVASFGLPRTWDPGALLRALNGLLPADVRAVDSRTVDAGFHARKSAVSKLYRYELDTGGVQLPTRRRVAAHVPWRLEPGPMEELAARYVGRHDFAAVASTGSDVTTTVRNVLRSEVRFAAETLVYEVEADGFLRKMVRSLVGGLIEAGRDRRSAHELMALLNGRDRRAWPAPAAPHGLTLVLVRYGPEGA